MAYPSTAQMTTYIGNLSVDLIAEGTKPHTDLFIQLLYGVLTTGRGNIVTHNGEVVVHDGDIVYLGA